MYICDVLRELVRFEQLKNYSFHYHCNSLLLNNSPVKDIPFLLSLFTFVQISSNRSNHQEACKIAKNFIIVKKPLWRDLSQKNYCPSQVCFPVKFVNFCFVARKLWSRYCLWRSVILLNMQAVSLQLYKNYTRPRTIY